MNKKYVFHIIIAFFFLNLLTQTSNSFMLNENKDNVIYHNDEEKKAWEIIYLPYAKHLRLVTKTMTILDLAKATEKNEKNIDLISEIMNRTHHERRKLLVKWERDKGYIDTESENLLNITPLIRRKLLAEISEEEENGKKETYNFSFKIGKAIVSSASAIATFSVAKYVGVDVKEATKLTALIFASASAVLNVFEVIGRGTYNIIKRVWKKLKKEHDEEIKIPPLQNMPVLPKNYERVDVYSYGL